MSQHNAELVQRAHRLIEDLHATQPESFDSAFRDYLDEEFELSSPAVYPEGAQVFKGREGLERWIASTSEVWREWRCEPERLVDADDDQVVALVRLIARGSASGVLVDRETAHVWTVRDGRVTRCEVYLDRLEALEAVGLQSAAPYTAGLASSSRVTGRTRPARRRLPPQPHFSA